MVDPVHRPAEPAGTAVLHLEETVVAVGLAVGAADRLERLRAEPHAVQELKAGQALLEGHLVHVLPGPREEHNC